MQELEKYQDDMFKALSSLKPGDKIKAFIYLDDNIRKYIVIANNPITKHIIIKRTGVSGFLYGLREYNYSDSIFSYHLQLNTNEQTK